MAISHNSSRSTYIARIARSSLLLHSFLVINVIDDHSLFILTCIRDFSSLLLCTSLSVSAAFGSRPLVYFCCVCDRLRYRTDEGNDSMRRFVQCGVDRCLLYRTRVPVDLLLRCLEQHCASAFPQGSEKYAAGMEKKVEEVASRPSSECAAACGRSVGNEYLECLNQSCGINQRPGTSAFCPSVCHLMSPENVKGCLERYCPVGVNQEDQRNKRNEEDSVTTETKEISEMNQEDQGGELRPKIMNQELETMLIRAG